MASVDEREARYAEAVAKSEGVTPGTDPWHDAAARAVMAVADEELAESRAEVERLTAQWFKEHDLRAAAENETRALRERLTALADEQWLDPVNYKEPVAAVLRTIQSRLAALAASPAVDTTPEPTPDVRLHNPGCVDCDNGVTEWHRSRTDRPNLLRRPTPAAEPQAEDTTPTEQQTQSGA